MLKITAKPENILTNANIMRLVEAWFVTAYDSNADTLREVLRIQVYTSKTAKAWTRLILNVSAYDIHTHQYTYGTGKGTAEFYYSTALENALERALEDAGIMGYTWDSSNMTYQNLYALCEQLAQANGIQPNHYHITRPQCGNN
jgi:hypothetical protein